MKLILYIFRYHQIIFDLSLCCIMKFPLVQNLFFSPLFFSSSLIPSQSFCHLAMYPLSARLLLSLLLQVLLLPLYIILLLCSVQQNEGEEEEEWHCIPQQFLENYQSRIMKGKMPFVHNNRELQQKKDCKSNPHAQVILFDDIYLVEDIVMCSNKFMP